MDRTASLESILLHPVFIRYPAVHFVGNTWKIGKSGRLTAIVAGTNFFNENAEGLNADQVAQDPRRQLLSARAEARVVCHSPCFPGCNMLSVIPFGHALDRAWRKAAESAADDYAAKGGASAALNLASALIKVARLAPAGCRPAIPAGVSLIVEDPGSIATRVRHLTEVAAIPAHSRQTPKPVLGFVLCVCFSSFLVSLVLAVSSPGLLARIHSAMEHVVSALQ